MYCKDCGHVLDDDTTFCPTCGCKQRLNPDNKVYARDHFIVSTKDGHKYILHKDVIKQRYSENANLYHEIGIDSNTGNEVSIHEILKRRGKRRPIIVFKNLLAAALILCIVAVAGYFLASMYKHLFPGKYDIASISEKYKDSIVAINIYDRRGKQIGMGTGVIINEDGLILTNNHVIEEAEQAEVKLANGLTFPVKDIVFGSSQYDLALIRIAAKNLKPARVGNSDKIKMGDPIICIGNPVGIANTISEGIISNILDFSKEIKLIQFTAPISPGSSGGVLINSKGETIGITTLYLTIGQNLNFAIPINYLPILLEHSAPEVQTFAEKPNFPETTRQGSASRYDQQTTVTRPYEQDSDYDEGTGSSDYVLPESSKKILSIKDVEHLSRRDLSVARNEIFARHGYVFGDKPKVRWLKEYFESKSWYEPDESYQGRINDIEKRNVELIKAQEERLEANDRAESYDNVRQSVDGDWKSSSGRTFTITNFSDRMKVALKGSDQTFPAKWISNNTFEFKSDKVYTAVIINKDLIEVSSGGIHLTWSRK